MPPIRKSEAYCFGLSVRHAFYVSCNFGTLNARVLIFHVWIPHGKIADLYCFLFRGMSLSGVMPLQQCDATLFSKISEKVFELGH